MPSSFSRSIVLAFRPPLRPFTPGIFDSLPRFVAATRGEDGRGLQTVRPPRSLPPGGRWVPEPSVLCGGLAIVTAAAQGHVVAGVPKECLVPAMGRDVIHHGRRTHDPGRLTRRAERMLTQDPRAVLLPASPVAPRGRTPPLLILGATTRDAGPAPREAGALWSRTGTPRRDRHAYSPSATVIAPLWAGPTVHRPGAPAQARRPSPAAPGPHAWYPTSGGPAG